ncbi:hypothetical protein LC608_31700 [Nostoc sp. XA010]|uniref:hypothetical protein n=1 Tax=Nostoc sp. XA010 TaxID=2780407 RepID=UPI001E32878A|nr:hypothetical protein [Nostoc sp. XA010]MCC5661438.1 hypothetical protein [Nostoc sp. XA010]
MKQSADYYRKVFELISGEISNRRWRQIRNELERSGVVVTQKSVQSYARLKTQYPRTVLTKKAIQIVEDFQSNCHPTHKFTGEELLNILREIKPHVTDRMLLNAFYKAHIQFSKQSVYTLNQASKVVFFTAISRNK